MRRLFISCSYMLIAGNLALAGTVFNMETKIPGEVQSTTVTVDGKNLKVVTEGETSNNPTMIYRGDRKEMLLIDIEGKTWTKLDKTTMASLGKRVNPAMEQMRKQMEEQMKNIPPERRAMMEKMMKGRGLGRVMMEKRPSLDVRKTNKTKTINDYPCVKYETFEESKKVAEHWVTDWKNVRGAGEAKEVFLDMAKFSREIFESSFTDMKMMKRNDFQMWEKVEGFPILTNILSDGKITREILLKSVEDRSVSSVAFDPPEDYEPRDILRSIAPSTKN